jgi:hypothetical protein
MTQPIAPELFDLLDVYISDIENGKITPTPTLASTSPALTFCENFYAQFFQNVLDNEITGFDRETKQKAIRLRLRLKEHKSPATTIQLVTWFEQLCDIYPNVLALGYGGGTKAAFLSFHEGFLLTLLERVSAWAKVANYPEVEQRASSTLSALRNALKLIAK